MLASAAGFAVMAASARLLPEIPPIEKVFFRSLISVVLTLGALKHAGLSIKPNRPMMLFIRALFGFAGLWCYFSAIDRLPLGTAVTVYNTTPLFAAVVGVLVLGETLRGRQVLSLFLGLGGIALIKGLSPELSVSGLMFGFGTAIFSAVAYSLVRSLTRTEHSLVIVLAFPLLSVPLAAAFGVSSFVMPTGIAWLWVLLLGVGTQLGQVCLTNGLRHHTATRATQIGFVGVVFAMLLGIPIGDGWPDLAQLIGAVVVFASLSLGRK